MKTLIAVDLEIPADEMVLALFEEEYYFILKTDFSKNRYAEFKQVNQFRFFAIPDEVLSESIEESLTLSHRNICEMCSVNEYFYVNNDNGSSYLIEADAETKFAVRGSTLDGKVLLELNF